MPNIMHLQDVYKIYRDGGIETVALRNAQLMIQPGEFVAITGRSGAGKSTLLSLLGGLAKPSAGRVLLHGTDITQLNETERARLRRAEIGIVYQANNLIPFLSAYENVLLPLQLANTAQATQRAKTLLDDVGLAARMNHRPGMLSGGERQRVAIAVALANAPKVLLADELTGELDSTTADQIMELLQRVNADRKLTIIMVTHSQRVAARAIRQISISDGQLTEQEVLHAA